MFCLTRRSAINLVAPYRANRFRQSFTDQKIADLTSGNKTIYCLKCDQKVVFRGKCQIEKDSGAGARIITKDPSEDVRTHEEGWAFISRKLGICVAEYGEFENYVTTAEVEEYRKSVILRNEKLSQRGVPLSQQMDPNFAAAMHSRNVFLRKRKEENEKYILEQVNRKEHE